jgi:hypothetical protein
MSVRWQENDLVFASSMRAPLNQRNMQRDFDQLMHSAELPKIRFRDLLHNAASLMRKGHSSIVNVSGYLRDSSLRIMLEIYAHLIPDGFDEIARTMSAIFVSEVV